MVKTLNISKLHENFMLGELLTLVLLVKRRLTIEQCKFKKLKSFVYNLTLNTLLPSYK